MIYRLQNKKTPKRAFFFTWNSYLVQLNKKSVKIYIVPSKEREPTMLLKSKICFTVLAVYEMAAVSILHFQRICDAIFTPVFCDSWYRYFLFCVIVPLVIMLILMWIREIVRAHRRRKFFRRARSTISGVLSSIRGKVSENIDIRDMERVITAAVLVGIKRYADKHPNLRHNVNHIMDIANGDAEIDIMSMDDEIKTNTVRRTQNKNKTTAKKKK